MDKETFEKIERKKVHFLLALEEFDGGTLDVDEMKEDYESLFQIIKQQQQEIERYREGLCALLAMSIEGGTDVLTDVYTNLLLGDELHDFYKKYVPKGKESLKQYE